VQFALRRHHRFIHHEQESDLIMENETIIALKACKQVKKENGMREVNFWVLKVCIE
jgi:hypothetical protein